MNLSSITPLILTYNEEANLERTLSALGWASRIVIVDSFSTDRTLEIAASFDSVAVFQRTFDSHAAQWNFGLDLIQTEWVLSLDADYLLSGELLDEITRVPSDPAVDAFSIRFKYCVHGRPLRATLLPPRLALFRKSRCRFVEDGHTQKLATAGTCDALAGFMYHDDRKPLGRWLEAQGRYALLEAETLLSSPVSQLNLADRIRRQIVFAPWLVVVYTLFCKRLIFDGWPGLFYVFQRAYAELLLSLHLIEMKTGHKILDNPATRKGQTRTLNNHVIPK